MNCGNLAKYDRTPPRIIQPMETDWISYLSCSLSRLGKDLIKLAVERKTCDVQAECQVVGLKNCGLRNVI